VILTGTEVDISVPTWNKSWCFCSYSWYLSLTWNTKNRKLMFLFLQKLKFLPLSRMFLFLPGNESWCFGSYLEHKLCFFSYLEHKLMFMFLPGAESDVPVPTWSKSWCSCSNRGAEADVSVPTLSRKWCSCTPSCCTVLGRP
jgi:hypothetical protein